MCEYRRLLKFIAPLFVLMLSAVGRTSAAETVLAVPAFYSASTCASSSCHGGATEKSCQLTIWSTRDPHSKSYAALTNARSARMAEALQIPNPTTSARCTVCHAPLSSVPLPGADASAPSRTLAAESVSCVSCHGPADAWLRTHTRPDYTHAERVSAGMKDLHSSYVRANTCVACHQNIDPELVSKARHPELIFELDGQAASQPKHWQELPGWSAAQNWYVGQLVALREVSWALSQKTAAPDRDEPRARALAWVTARAAGTTLAPVNDFAATVTAADTRARLASGETWMPSHASETLRRLVATAADFRETSVTQPEQSRRAEVLVLAFDRLLSAQPAATKATFANASAELNKLFPLIQSRPDFAPAEFAKALEAFAATLP